MVQGREFVRRAIAEGVHLDRVSLGHPVRGGGMRQVGDLGENRVERRLRVRLPRVQLLERCRRRFGLGDQPLTLARVAGGPDLSPEGPLPPAKLIPLRDEGAPLGVERLCLLHRLSRNPTAGKGRRHSGGVLPDQADVDHGGAR